MNPQSEDLARTVTEARLAAARHRHLARLAKDTRHETRPVGRPLVRVGWWRRWSGRRLVLRTPSAAAAPGHGPAGIEGILDRTAQRVVADGTCAEAPVLRAMSVAARRVSPGAAAALVDWDGPEPARLRAFGIVHGIVLHSLDAPARQALLDQLRRAARDEVRGLAAVGPADVTPTAPESAGLASAELLCAEVSAATRPTGALPDERGEAA
jgi:hypothetical protein